MFGYNWTTILIHCNDDKQQISQTKIVCYTGSQAYITSLIYVLYTLCYGNMSLSGVEGLSLGVLKRFFFYLKILLLLEICKKNVS